MKIFSSQFWGTILIWAGILLFIAVIYDSVRPFFPSHSPYPWVRKLYSSPREGRSGKSPSIGRKRENRPHRAPVQVGDNGFLTNNIYETKGDYSLWVWRVLPEKKTGDTVKVKIAHAAEGKQGGFEIVAFADTDGNSKPDREIARSDYLTAKKPGQWSTFEFKTGEKSIFVGCTWPPGSNTWVYRDNGPWPSSGYPFEPPKGRYDPLFYHTISSHEARSAGPAITNMQVSFSN